MYCTNCDTVASQPLIIEKVGVQPSFVTTIIIGEGLTLTSVDGTSTIGLESNSEQDKNSVSPTFTNVLTYTYIHGLNKIPTVSVLDLSENIIGVSTNVTLTTVTINSNVPISGTIICN